MAVSQSQCFHEDEHEILLTFFSNDDGCDP